MDNKIEICVGSAVAAYEAQCCGADRVELCAALSEGGLTPSWGEIAMARRLLTTTKLHVIVRPRKGDFLYSDIERDTILADIRQARQLEVDGVVIGALTADGNIDIDFTRQMIVAAAGMSITFHRAFDMCRSQTDALEQLIDLGCHRVLTSGGYATAEKGAEQLQKLVHQAANRIIIMPGCGINVANIEHIARTTVAHEFHFSASRTAPGKMQYRNPIVSMGGNGSADEYAVSVADCDKICKIRTILDNL